MTEKLITTGALAEHLTALAGRLRAVPPGAEPIDASLFLHIGGYLPQYRDGDDEATRMATVDQLAALFGQTAARANDHGTARENYRADHDQDGFDLRITTRVNPPPRCACGAACAHDQGWHVSITGDVGTYVGPEAMGIDWMTGNGLSEAIPPAYTRWIGARVLTALSTRERAA